MGVERVAGRYGVMHVPELGGWVVVDADAFRIAEPAELWRTPEGARDAAERHAAADEDEALEQRRIADEITRRGVERR